MQNEYLRQVIYESIDRYLKDIINETHVRTLYHFLSPKQLRYIARYGFRLSDSEKEWSISPKLPNNLCFTRNRNGVQGFPYMTSKYGYGGTVHNDALDWIIIRLEIDTARLGRYGKVKPFDYMYHFNRDEGNTLQSSREDVAMLATDNYDEMSDEEIYNQPYSQAEERLYSNLKSIGKDDALRLIKRIDIYLDFERIYSDSGIWKESDDFLKWVRKTFNGTSIFIYDKINEFNLQIYPSTDKAQ